MCALLVLAAALGAALAMRWHLLGDPIAGVDEQFYLLVGDRLWSGALPYVDIWDRKPIGLFLIYAAIRALPGDGVLAYQLVGTFCLAVTGTLATGIARRGAGWPASLAAGMATMAFATLMGQGLGESPIFYDPLVAGAAWLILRVRDDGAAPRTFALGLTAMALCGLAIAIKTVAVFEGIAFGLLLLAAHHSAGMSRRGVARRAVAYAALGAAPMALAAAIYAMLGHWHDFWFANVVSILLRTGGADAASGVQLIATLMLLMPLLLTALLALRSMAPPDDRVPLAAWAVATGLGFVSIGYFTFHYALPMIAPIAILAARDLPRRAGIVGLALVAAFAGWVTSTPSPTQRDRADVARLIAALPARVHDQCLLVREGPTIVYHLANACLATRYAFPSHLSAASEAGATGVPQQQIVAEALARRPAAIVDADHPADAGRMIAAGYVPHARVSLRLYGTTRATLSVWWRRDVVSQISSLGPYRPKQA